MPQTGHLLIELCKRSGHAERIEDCLPDSDAIGGATSCTLDRSREGRDHAWDEFSTSVTAGTLFRRSLYTGMSDARTGNPKAAPSRTFRADLCRLKAVSSSGARAKSNDPDKDFSQGTNFASVSYTHLRAHET